MKNILLTLLLVVLASSTTTALEIDTIWYRVMGAGAQDVDFTPDDKYVIAWTNGIEFWEVQHGIKEFFVPSETVGDYNFNEEYLVFAQDSTPKLLNWQTREVVEGFEKQDENIGRIRTAKSKNEFMANTYHYDDKLDNVYSNIIYFYDVDNKRKVDSFDLGSSFEKNNFKWKKTVHEYGYVGKNDELIYVIIDDANDVIENINPMFREKHYYVNFYNRETKELVDSVYSFTNTNEHYGGFNKMQVMNDRSKIAWNHNGGEINFYDINQKRFYDKLVFDIADYVNATDINLSRDDRIITVTNQEVTFLKIYNIKNRTFLHEYTKGSFQYSSFSNNGELLITNIGSWLILLPSHLGTTLVNNNENDFYDMSVSPNPTNDKIHISLSHEKTEYIRLSLVDLIGNEVGLIEEGLMNTSSYTKDYDVSDLPPSIYFIRLEIGNEVVTKQFIKE